VKYLAPYIYKAKTSSGQVVTGIFDASDKNMVVALLREKGYYPLQIEEDKASGREVKPGFLKKVSSRDLAIFCRQFHTMIDAGVSVLSCLDMLRKQTENPKLAAVTGEVYEEVQKGKSLAEAMDMHKKVYPVILVRLIEVGEVGGILDTVLDRLTRHFEKENRMQQKIKTAMAYPAVIGCLALLMVVFMLAFVVPNFVSMFKTFGAELPTPTRILLDVSNTVKDVRFLAGLAAAIVLLAYLFSRFKSSSTGKRIIDTLKVNMPLVGKNMKKILASRFARTMSSLLNSGVPLIQALEVTGKVIDNHIVSAGLEKVSEDIKRGSNLAGPLERMKIFPAMVVHMVSVGEEAGTLDSIMGKVADFYDDEVDTAIGQLISILEPLMIFVLAAVVGSIVVAMILPVFSMYGNIG
jgi:type IV pilus assembly protein PilC